jgi:hypothetical protein
MSVVWGTDITDVYMMIFLPSAIVSSYVEQIGLLRGFLAGMMWFTFEDIPA